MTSILANIYIYTLSQKVCRLMFDNNFDKCEPFFKVLLPIDS